MTGFRISRKSFAKTLPRSVFLPCFAPQSSVHTGLVGPGLERTHRSSPSRPAHHVVRYYRLCSRHCMCIYSTEIQSKSDGCMNAEGARFHAGAA
ncbi:uncharacterized protein LOC120511687 isoform X2 [Passer montanus]|uniref:uncharacterized protein LOC120511687 isoform X2 n=1 Tax=Passer montanus TaxID=9160 RepID=UPI001961DD35|nr:uncharacterized protein LOC120511687 isoform X2 [Passer montanus]